mmetsp:Transcript_75679/g.204360  ORF Transcript_75679/g.204360 Transcript_75679/m.204360 type:complete len:172 (+) Transcript_75679:2-517(+)
MEVAVASMDWDAMLDAVSSLELLAHDQQPRILMQRARAQAKNWMFDNHVRSRDLEHCLICLESVQTRLGVACSAHSHFICGGCLVQHVRAEMALPDGGLPRHPEGEVQCCGRVESRRCPEILPSAAILRCSGDSLRDLLCGSRRIAEHRVAAQMSMAHAAETRGCLRRSSS